MGADFECLRNEFREILCTHLSLDLIVAGTDDSGAHLFASDAGERLVSQDERGFAAVGSGAKYAIGALQVDGVNPSTDVAKAILMLYRGKKAAELAFGVGQATDSQFSEPANRSCA